jgi:hypothetical protein
MQALNGEVQRTITFFSFLAPKSKDGSQLAASFYGECVRSPGLDEPGAPKEQIIVGQFDEEPEQ